MLRLFLALALPDDIVERLEALQSGLPGARWVDPENLHLTLRFIGEQPNNLVDELAEELGRLDCPPFDLRFSGLGTFEPTRRESGALWAGVQPEPLLARLQRKLERMVQELGIPAESRRFVPHVTVARLRDTPELALARYLQANNLFAAGPMRVDSVTLFRSHLGKDGPHYEPLLDVELREEKFVGIQGLPTPLV